MTTPARPVGLGLGSGTPAADIPLLAELAERAGLSELWLTEDCFFTAGVSSAASGLAATTTMSVGTAALSVMTRHPAVLAMETATLAGLHPGRFNLGVGLGVPEWLHQMGLMPTSPLTAMREGVAALRTLLSGEVADTEGRVFTLRDIQLSQPPASPPPIYLAATGPKMLELSGEIADGTLGSVLAGTRYVEGMRQRISAGQQRTGAAKPHRIVVLALYAVDPAPALALAAARKAAAFFLAIDPRTPLSDAYGISDQVEDMASRGGGGAGALAIVQRELPEPWLADLTISGDPDMCVDGIQRLLAAGADSVCLCPVEGLDLEAVVRLTADHVVPYI